jgi:hypothetical protein
MDLSKTKKVTSKLGHLHLWPYVYDFLFSSPRLHVANVHVEADMCTGMLSPCSSQVSEKEEHNQL